MYTKFPWDSLSCSLPQLIFNLISKGGSYYNILWRGLNGGRNNIIIKPENVNLIRLGPPAKRILIGHQDRWNSRPHLPRRPEARVPQGRTPSRDPTRQGRPEIPGPRRRRVSPLQREAGRSGRVGQITSRSDVWCGAFA